MTLGVACCPTCLCVSNVHVPCVRQRAWRACLQKRASRALAMMVLRAKVRERGTGGLEVSNFMMR